MNNPETMAILVTQDTGRRQTKQQQQKKQQTNKNKKNNNKQTKTKHYTEIKMMSSTDPH